jgi:glucose dehydrogenase
MEFQGRQHKVVLWGNRNGFFYALDGTSGQFLVGKPYTKVNWATGLDERGRPMRPPNMTPSNEGTVIYPGPIGGTNWYSASYSPHTRLFYIPALDGYYAHFVKTRDQYKEGQLYFGGTATLPVLPLRGVQLNSRREEDGYGVVRAVDPKTGERK